jgi:hypothetical protein
MSKGETAAEPSMDEILSSIRKIIAEDEVEEAPAAKPVEADAAQPADLGGATPPAATEVAAGDDGFDDDDILELTEDDELEPEADVARDAAPAPPVPASAERAAAALPEDAPVEAAPDQLEAVPQEPGADMAQQLSAALLDGGTASAASGALQRLSAAMMPGTAVPAGDRTIEAFLADLVRPELKAWLDAHLPGLVERIVEREIKKLVRDAQPE